MSVVISHHVQYLMLLHLDAASGYSPFLLSLFGYAYLHTNLQTTELAGMVACDTTMLMQLLLRTSVQATAAQVDQSEAAQRPDQWT